MRFGDKAMSYDKHARIQATTSQWLAEWLEKSGAGLEAIEFGAGTGGFTRFLEDLMFDRLVATDVSKRMIQVGKGVCRGADWQVEDAWNPTCRTFDRIYSSNLLQWCESPSKVLAKWKAMLRPGGQLLASIFVKDSLDAFTSIDPRFGAFPWRSSEQWIQCFKDAGWRVERFDERHDTETFPNALSALKSLHALGAVKERRMSYREVKQFLKHCNESQFEGSFNLSWRSLRIECGA